MKNYIAYLISRYIMPDYQAHKRAALYYTSANEVTLRRELERCQKRLIVAEAHINMFRELNSGTIEKALALPEEQMVPFVHELVMDIEHTRRYLK